MAVPFFKAFRSTVSPPNERNISPQDKLLVDPITGAPVGLMARTANGADARFTPVNLSAAQLLSPTAEMIADLDATYRLDEAPYSRFMSNGTDLIPVGGSNETEVLIPPGFNYVFDAPLTITYPQQLTVEGGIRVV